MRRSVATTLTAVAALCLSGLAVTPAAAAPADPALSVRNTPVCPSPVPGTVGCHAVRHDVVDQQGKPVQPTATAPRGYAPGDLQAAYRLPGTAFVPPAGSAPTVAIVDAYDDPNAEADLGVYRSTYGLPACTTVNGCFRKVNQTGGTKPPRADGGWAQEISLDLDMVSAACPNCKILLVEAKTASFSDLAAAVNYAASQHVAAISNSYGGSDQSGSTLASAYDHKGIAVTASTGDNGYGVESPASFTNVVAVGGTSLTRDTSTRGFTESAWTGAGSGCSTLNARPTWQVGTSCTGKANADVSAVADPNTGVAVYDSYSYQGVSGWLVFGGTSASAPLVASVYAQGTSGTSGKYAAEFTWGQSPGTGLNDVTSGSNGTCSTPVWCAARAGWDGPTGLGTPNGTSAF